MYIRATASGENTGSMIESDKGEAEKVRTYIWFEEFGPAMCWGIRVIGRGAETARTTR